MLKSHGIEMAPSRCRVSNGKIELCRNFLMIELYSMLANPSATMSKSIQLSSYFLFVRCTLVTSNAAAVEEGGRKLGRRAAVVTHSSVAQQEQCQ